MEEPLMLLLGGQLPLVPPLHLQPPWNRNTEAIYLASEVSVFPKSVFSLTKLVRLRSIGLLIRYITWCCPWHCRVFVQKVHGKWNE